MGKRGTKTKRVKNREPNGRASRQPKHVAERNLLDLDQEQRDTVSVALDARERVFGVKPSQSRDQMAGSVIGRWCLQNTISRAQYDAAMLFLESYTRNLLAIDAPPLPAAVDLNRTHGRPVGMENAAQLRKWRAEYKAATEAIQIKQNEIRLQGNLYGALYAVVVRDVDLDHLAGDTRTALNALVRHYGLMAKEAA